MHIKESYAVFTLADGSKEKQYADDRFIALTNEVVEQRGLSVEELKVLFAERLEEFIAEFPLPIVKGEVYVNGEKFVDYSKNVGKFGFRA